MIYSSYKRCQARAQTFLEAVVKANRTPSVLVVVFVLLREQMFVIKIRILLNHCACVSKMSTCVK